MKTQLSSCLYCESQNEQKIKKEEIQMIEIFLIIFFRINKSTSEPNNAPLFLFIGIIINYKANKKKVLYKNKSNLI